MKPIVKKILVAISGSNSSINASKYAIMLAKTFKWELVALYVIDTSTIKELLLSKIFIEEESDDFEKNLEANGKRYLDYVEELAKNKSVKVKKVLKRGGIASMIMETSTDEDCDLIIMGGWEVNRSKRDLISKAHMDLLMDSKKSVLIVKEEEVENLYKKFR
ncbi:MAG: universal stress protein [Spirochaetes bacterium]|nr:universal stress protein [Spirochaetota bacterium]